MTQPVRIEHDLLGDRAVPADAYYGIHTLRALENFSITGTPISHYPELVNALACVKQAAAIANAELRLLEEKRSVARFRNTYIDIENAIVGYEIEKMAKKIGISH